MGTLKLELDKAMTVGTAFLLIGIAWLLFWLGPAYPLFEKDPRWGHNFIIPIVFITVGLAYNLRKLSCQLITVISAFVVTIPTMLAILPWDTGIIIAIAFLIVVVILFLVEKGGTELMHPNPRLRAWLSIHLLNFSYIGLAHMPLIFFVTRWSNPAPFLNDLPVEHDIPTTIFNAMLLVLIPLAAMERYVKTLGGFAVSKLCFAWAILMIIIPLLSIR
ncbi:MAG: hypothetical protein O8C66_12280 [Candidatus Methanoperedens sp.]|nr:hypothetical protein [Candidatus Methanoperedens sp.]MCZ7371277.1 hypothetical protein [Candidatus Methanoperedens sp.]